MTEAPADKTENPEASVDGTGDPEAIIRDDNLRLILAAQEGDFIQKKLDYSRRAIRRRGVSTVLAVLFVYGLAKAEPIFPALYVTNSVWIMIALILGICVAFFTGFSSIAAVVNLHRYKEMKQEHDVFLSGYGRTTGE